MKAHKSNGIALDIKTPGDYGDYELISRVQRNGIQKGHAKNQSVTDSVDGEESDDEEDAEEEDDDEDENETVPPSKKRKTTTKMQEDNQQVVETSFNTQSQKSIQQAFQAGSQTPQMAMYNFNTGPPIIQHQQPILFQQQQQQQNQSQQPYPYQQLRPPLQRNMTPMSQQQQIQHHQRSELPDETVPASNPTRSSFNAQQPLNNYQYPAFQFSPATPSSQRSELLPSISAAVVPNSNNEQHPQYDTSRARSLNSNISKRPILRVQIPEDSSLELPKPNVGNGGDSAMTITAVDTSKQSIDTKEEQISSSSAKENLSADGSSNKPSAVGLSSNKSTPVSATHPSRPFALPPLQTSQHVQAAHHQPHQQNFKFTGEQTPLTGGLPSKYVPDLFPSPSNFYSNEWNIPFGSGNTPYPNSAGPHQLPSEGQNANASNGNGPPRLTKLPSINPDVVDSPLQHLSKDPKDQTITITKTANNADSGGRKIDFRDTGR
jgi:MADS-box transcription factor